MKVRPQLNAEDRAKVLEQSSRAACFGGLLELRAGGKVLAAEADRDELLARAVARQRVELEVDLLAYEQGMRDQAGQVIKNRNRVRFRDGAMLRLGRTGKGTPFLRDHLKWDSTAVGGRVLASATEKVDDAGHYRIKQTVLLTEPGAVERALRGLTSAVSIGWRPTGPVLCTACGTEILTECWHWPGDVIKAGDQEFEVEWEFTEAELVETSEVPVPGVPTAGIEGIRAALSAALSSGPPAASAPPQEKTMEKLRQALAAKLGLAATASDDEIQKAVDALAADSKELKVVEKELAILQAEAAIDKQSAADEFIASALKQGKIKPSDEKAWRDLFELAPDRARKRMDERAAHSATPVGETRQSDAAPAPDPAAELGRDKKAAKVLADAGVDYAAAVKYAGVFGAKDPKAAIAKHAAGVEEN